MEQNTLTSDKIVFGITRIALGFVMFWAGIDKIFGLGHATTPDKAYINGGSPTFYYLNFVTENSPFHSFFAAIAGHPVTDFLFVVGLTLIGLSLILGIGTRIAGISGAVLMFMMYLSALPMENNPLIDEHIIYALIFIYISVKKNVGTYIGLGNRWSNIIGNHPILA